MKYPRVPHFIFYKNYKTCNYSDFRKILYELLPDGKISKDRGRLIKVGENYIYPVYHPAAALRSTSVLEEFRKDFEKIPQVLKEAEELMKGKIHNDPSQDPNVDNDGQLGLGL